MDWGRGLVLLAGSMIGSAFAAPPPVVIVKRETIGVQSKEAPPQSSKAEPFEFMGINLGAQLGPECPTEQIPYAGAVYDLVAAKSACWTRLGMRPDAKTDSQNNDSLSIVPLGNKRPTGTKQVTGTIVNGSVEGLTVFTDGFVHAQELFDQLKQKLGKPTVEDVVQVTSAVGATFASPRAVWDLPGAYVKFNGIVGSVDSGLILVYTHAEKERVLAREKERSKSF